MSDLKRAEFLASFPPIQTAINFSGVDGARIKLDIPEIYLGEAAKLLAMKGQILRVVVTVEGGENVKKVNY